MHYCVYLTCIFCAFQDELVYVEVKETSRGLVVQAASSDLFGMDNIRNRTRSTYLPDDYVEAFNNSLYFAIKGVRYEAAFAHNQVLQ